MKCAMSLGLLCFSLVFAAGAGTGGAAVQAVEIRETKDAASIENRMVQVNYDLTSGTYSATDKKSGRIIISGAASKLNDFSSNAPGTVHACKSEPLGDALGMGRSLLVSSAVPGGPTLLLRISLYEEFGFIALAAGLENTTDKAIQLRRISPLQAGTAFGGFDVQSLYSTLDGDSGANKSKVIHDRSAKRASINNLLATFGKPGTKRSLVLGGLTYQEFEKHASVTRNPDSLRIEMYASDPVGKRIDPGMRYLADDRFYVDFLTDNPFDALEGYARALRLAQGIVLPGSSYPTMCTWFTQVPHFGGGSLMPGDPTLYANKKPVDARHGNLAQAGAGYCGQNDSAGAVEEMECVQRSGFLKYSPVGVRIVPDLYASWPNGMNTQQGWWDDEHWQRGPDNRARDVPRFYSSNGQFVSPYETTRKWAGAITALGGIPGIYVQTGFRSQDYADKFPGHMIGNDANTPHLNEKGEQLYRMGKEPRKLGFDYTDPGFITHLRSVWENLRLAGVRSVMFDYPDFPFTGWPEGGMEDPYATTAMHYRNIYRLAKQGLGQDSWIDERGIGRGTDVTLGLVDSKRTEGDTDLLNPEIVSKAGLRWYKNRVVINWDMDGKNPFHAVPNNRDGIRAMWTMAYVASGRMVLASSFGRMTGEMAHDLSRIYPFHAGRQSARPVDAFASENPKVYDFRVNDGWHQLTFYNTDETKESSIGVNLAGDTAFGALGLHPEKEYYVYDFWNDQLVCKIAGKARLEQTLRPGEARMLSVREVREFPQYLSTSRHLMQGYVDMLGCDWNGKQKMLQGVSAVVGGEPYIVIIAYNGRKPVSAKVDDGIYESLKASAYPEGAKLATATIRKLPGADDLAELILNRPDNGPVAWSVVFE